MLPPSLPYERVAIEAAREVLDEAPSPSSRASGEASSRPRWKRRAPQAEDLGLADPTVSWLARLPTAVRPAALPRRFPRIANRLAVEWHAPERCEAYMKTLLISDRPSRQGFPVEVAREIALLFDFLRQSPAPPPWTAGPIR